MFELYDYFKPNIYLISRAPEAPHPLPYQKTRKYVETTYENLQKIQTNTPKEKHQNTYESNVKFHPAWGLHPGRTLEGCFLNCVGLCVAIVKSGR